MSTYFKLRKEYFDRGLNFIFKTPYKEKVDFVIYQGEIEEDEISWKPVEKYFKTDLILLEERFAIKFHDSVHHYFNSYWFADLDGFIGDHYISLEAVLPNIELDSFKEKLEGYEKNHRKLDKIPIGVEGNGSLVVLNNVSGKVELEEFERGLFIEVSNSLNELISSLRIQK
ncbi:SecY-interacting protein Syd [Bacillus mycoides]|uniref:SecY-interacting protein Syd n=1 Tax=Bacillus mycoides TaxID=1405 RepID=UPI003D1D19AE